MLNIAYAIIYHQRIPIRQVACCKTRVAMLHSTKTAVYPSCGEMSDKATDVPILSIYNNQELGATDPKTSQTDVIMLAA